MTIDRESFSTALQFIAVLVMPVISMIYTWIATRDKDNSQHIKAVEAALGEVIALHASRIDRLETDVKHLPGQDDAPGTGLLADDLQHLPTVGLEHDDVARIFGFEPVQHCQSPLC